MDDDNGFRVVESIENEPICAASKYVSTFNFSKLIQNGIGLQNSTSP